MKYLMTLLALTIVAISTIAVLSQTQAGPPWTYTAPVPVLSATSGAMGGSLLALGGCNTTDVTVTGATTSMAATASPVGALASGIQWQAAVISSNTVRVYECALLSITPASTTFNIRVMQ
jgi:Cys-tRNA synthase (O-phospho-L-seryl-tRNA:Cys-tRNA synthase)